MSNFISDFLNQKLKEKNENNVDTEYNNKVLTDMDDDNKIFAEKNKDIKGDELEDKIKNIGTYLEDYDTDINLQNVKKGTSKQLSGYLGNDFNLDNSIMKMNKDEITNNLDNGESPINSVNSKKNKSTSTIKIQKSENSKKILWIFLQFVIGVMLIVGTFFYLKHHETEYRFMKSSIDLWTSIFTKLLSKFDGIIGENAKESYIKKKDKYLTNLITFEKKLKSCNNIKDTKKEKDKIIYRIETLKQILINTSLDKFIDNQTRYELELNAIKSSVDNFCKL